MIKLLKNVTATYLFSRIESLFFKAEALYLIEVESSFKRDHVVSGNPSDCLVSGVPGCVECQRCFARH